MLKKIFLSAMLVVAGVFVTFLPNLGTAIPVKAQARASSVVSSKYPLLKKYSWECWSPKEPNKPLMSGCVYSDTASARAAGNAHEAASGHKGYTLVIGCN